MSTWFHLINPHGNMVEVEKEKAEALLAQKDTKYRRATKDEIESYNFKRGIMNGTGNAELDIYLLTSRSKADGYGQSQGWLVDALAKNGVRIGPDFHGQKIGIQYGYPYRIDQLPTPIKVLFSMFESTSIPAEWASLCSRADKIITPSQFSAAAFGARGIEAEVIPLGYNHNSYQWLDRSNRPEQPFTFLMYDAFNTRKGWDILFRAFTEEFKDNKNVKLILKTIRALPFPISKNQYPNIEVVKGELTEKEMSDLMYRSDAFVFPSRGEGFGIPPLEAAATGLTVITPNASGMSEYWHEDHFVDVKYGDSPAIYDTWPGSEVGHMIKVDEADLRKRMRAVFEGGQKVAHEFGKKASEYVRENYTIDHTAEKLKKSLNSLHSGTQSKLNHDLVDISGRPKLAFFMDNIGFYSGGRYLNWLQAIILERIGFNVTVYTDRPPKFMRDFDLYKRPKVEICNLSDIDVQSDVYFGSPEPGVMAAARLARKYGKPCFVQLFDPPAWMKGNDRVDSTEMKRDINFKEWLNENPGLDLTIIGLTDNAIPALKQWYGSDHKYTAVHPPINSDLSRLFTTDRPRRDWIVAVSRNHPRKAWDEVLMAYRPYADRYELHVITHADHGMRDLAMRARIPHDRIVYHIGIPDIEKFKMLSLSKALISASHFEGFGMWSIEALSMGVPVACYDLKPLEEVGPGLFKAPLGNTLELSKQLGKALSAGIQPPSFDHDIEKLEKKYRNIFGVAVENRPKSQTIVSERTSNSPEISAMMIAINEQQFIGASLRSIAKRPEVYEIIIVEGADKLYPGADPETGLSTDATKQEIDAVIAEFPRKKIQYIRYGWASGKEELRQYCIDLSEKRGWGLFVDADEVWHDNEWAKLLRGISQNVNAGAIYFRHLHFWKQLDQIAVGGQWDSALFRLFRFTGADLTFKHHGSEIVEKVGDNLVEVGKNHGRAMLTDVYVHHYGAMKSEERIHEKLRYYKNRDQNLNVRDTWTDWKPGDETQWTHGGGSVRPYNGTHPVEIKS